MPGSFAALYYHLVFSTKNRAQLIDAELAPELHRYLGGSIKAAAGIPVVVGGVADHVHLLMALAKTVPVSDAIRDIKANSSRWVRQRGGDCVAFGWQEGFGIFSVGFEELGALKEYILGQEEHHRTVSFQDEYRRFLSQNGVEYDERFL